MASPHFSQSPQPLLALAFTILDGVCNASSLAAVTLLPLGDLAILKFCSPMFALLIGRFILKENVSIVKVIFALGILGGVIMVVQPPFLFGATTREVLSNEKSRRDDYPYYWCGVAIGISFAILTSTINVIVAKTTRRWN